MADNSLPLFFRDGRPFTGVPFLTDKQKPFTVVEHTCSRCGGAGGWRGWPNFTCFKCRVGDMGTPGSGIVKTEERLYTSAQLVKLNAAQEKRNAKRTALAVKKEAQRVAAHEAYRATFEAEHGPLLTRAAQWTGKDATLDDVVSRAQTTLLLTPGQVALVESIIARLTAQAVAATLSSHVGAVGDRVKVAVTVTNVASFTRRAFQSFRDETVFIVTMTDAAGNQFVSKTPNFSAEKGETFTLCATIKAHDEYKGVKQTVVQRVKQLAVAS